MWPRTPGARESDVSRIRLIVSVLSVLAGLAVSRSMAQEHKHGTGEKLGAVHFATSCNRVAQRDINRAVALLHSFQFSRAVEGFNVVLGEDATCSIAYWGIALSDWSNPFAPGIKDNRLLQLGRESVDRGTVVGAKTERERAYLAAVGKLYSDFESTSQQARLLAYRDAMGDVAARYPEDHEAQIFYALALVVAEDPEDKTYATGSRREQFSRNCLRRSRRIPVWRITLSMRTTCRRWQGGRSSRRDVTRKLPPMRLTRCTCHRIHLPAWDTGRSRLTATWQPQRPRGARVRRQKSCMPATTRLTPTCKPGRTRRQPAL